MSYADIYEHGRCTGCSEDVPAELLVEHMGKRYCTTCYLEVSGD